jgi:hypothetical protein
MSYEVDGSCTSHPGVVGSIPKREEPGKTGAPCVKVPGSSRVPEQLCNRSCSNKTHNSTVVQVPVRTAVVPLHDSPNLNKTLATLARTRLCSSSSSSSSSLNIKTVDTCALNPPPPPPLTTTQWTPLHRLESAHLLGHCRSEEAEASSFAPRFKASALTSSAPSCACPPGKKRRHAPL